MKFSGIEAAAEWLAIANDDFELAEECIGKKPRIACYLSQQTAEKAIKALYVANNLTFEFIHAIGTLLDGLKGTYPELSEVRSHASTLTAYEATTRYIDFETGANPLKEYTREDAETAVKMAENILRLCENIYGGLVRKGPMENR
ncbi:MAG: HEPN domain-containing protein [Thermaerobacter sp.]|nr:HEPN domain-containing protein [Thermaerobacter sp.]